MKIILHKQPQTTRIHRQGQVVVVPGGTRNRESGEIPPAPTYLFEDGDEYGWEDGNTREWEYD